MFEQIGAVLMPAPATRARTPVRRQSRARGRCEGVFWKRTDRQEVRQIVLAARKFELAEKQPGRRNGPLGTVAIEVLELFANLVDFRTGRLEPSIETIMGMVRRSRDAVVTALKALRAYGFIDWLRRYEPTGNETGPQVQQTSNAYRLSLPEKARRLLGRFGKAPPLPADVEQAEAERTAALDAHKRTLDMDELALFEVGDNPLGQALASLARSVKQRESAKQTESPPILSSNKTDGLSDRLLFRPMGGQADGRRR